MRAEIKGIFYILVFAICIVGLGLLIDRTEKPVLAQGGSFPPPSVSWFNLSIAQAFGSSTNTSTQLTRAASYPSYTSGAVITTFSNVTGSPSQCLLRFWFGGTQSGTALTSGVVGSGTGTFLNVANGSFITRTGLTASTISQPYTSITPQWTCTTYPATGVVNIEFIPDTTPAYNISNITANGTYQLKTGGGQLLRITINNVGTGTETMAVFDGLDCVSTPAIANIVPNSSTTLVTLDYGNILYNGLCISVGGTGTAGSYSVVYR